MNEQAINKVLTLYSDLETQLLDEIVKHFKINEEFINSDYFRIEKLQELGLLNQNIIDYIAKVTNKTPEEIKKALNQIGFETLNINNLNASYAGGLLKIDPTILIQNKVVENAINLAYNELTNRFLEISSKIENATRNAYLDVVEKTYIQTLGGKTYQESIRDALMELGDKGITTLTYKTTDKDGNIVGIRNYDVEGAVRRELVTATHNLVNNINQEVAEELDAEYVLLSEHIACRPTHFSWQGTIIKRTQIVAVTRYGEVDGMGGPNCKHYPSPYFGTARGSELKTITQEEAQKRYELAQKQTYLERGIRKWKRRERLFKNAEDKEYYQKCKEKVKEWQLRNKQFTEENDLTRSFSRENVENVTNNNDLVTPTYIRFNTADGYKPTNEVDNINAAILDMPENIQKQLQDSKWVVSTKGKALKDTSYYDRNSDTVYVYQGADKYEIIHEIGHVIETKNNILDDADYIQIRSQGLENYTPQFVKVCNLYTEPINIIESSKFVSELQGKIYAKDLKGIEFNANGNLNLNCLGDYFSEGFREYFENRSNLEKTDKALYDYIKGVVEK